jgi:large subunit ribosomal protein L14
MSSRVRQKSRAVSAKGILESRPYITRGIPTGAVINCADNTGAVKLRVVQVAGYKGRAGRYPAACVGDLITVSVKRGKAELRRQVFPAVVIRQKKLYRRPEGTWIQFEDNAAVLLTPEGELKGTEIRGPVAREAAEKWSRIAGAASMIV